MFGIRATILTIAAAVTVAALVSLACSQEETVAVTPQPEVKETTVAMEITSSAFTHGSSIPAQISCDSDDVSPKLSWSGIPEGTKTNRGHHGRSGCPWRHLGTLGCLWHIP